MQTLADANTFMWQHCNNTIRYLTYLKLEMADFFSTVKLMVKSANTLKSYQRKERRFLNWLSSEEPRCWDEGVPEVIIERITSEKICSLIPEESQRLDGSMKKFGTAVSINIALMYYYQRKKCKMQDDYLSQQERVF